MTQLPIDLDGVRLAARVAQVYGGIRRLAYAHIAPDLTIVQVSANFGRVLQVTPETLPGQPVTAVLWELVGSEDTLQQVLTGALPRYRLEHVNREQPDGSVTYLTFQVAPLPDRQLTGLLLLVEDSTENGRLQHQLTQDRNELRLLQQQLAQANAELQQLSRLKSLFLSVAAHELRTPLTAIFGYADLLLTSVGDEPTTTHREFLEIIRAQANRLSRLTRDILDLDQIEQGRLTIQPAVTDLNGLVAEVATVMRVEAEKRHIDLHVTLPDPPALLWAEADRILQILYNLMSNALKYTLTGGAIQLEVMADTESVTIRVQDSGLGMTPAQLAQLFQLYYRTEEAQASQIQGSGLGLYIVKMLTEAHNGRITVESEPQAGTTFICTFPSLAAAQPQL